MTAETKQMRHARHQLELLSASDPAAQANMLSYVAAFRMMLTGQRHDEERDALLIGAGFVLKHGSERILGSVCREDGLDRIYIAFDVDDPAGPPLCWGLFMPRWGQVACYGRCRLWSPANDGRALIVPSEDPGSGHFAYRSGAKLSRSEGLPPGDLAAGFRRADARLAKLVKSCERKHLRDRGFLNVIRSDGGRLDRRTSKIAA